MYKYMADMFGSSTDSKHFVSAVIVCGGKSERMGTGRSKQLIRIGGIAVAARTISAFEASGLINEIIVVTNKADSLKIAELINEFGFGKVTHLIIGGATRQKSAALGLQAVNSKADYIAVHDGARPLVSVGCIDRTIEAAFAKGSAAAAVKIKDTIKQTDENGIVMSTPDRNRLWAVQTPQVFELNLYHSALDCALQNGSDYTDDCQLVEAAGGQVQLVEGEYTNIKITTPEDVSLAEYVIKARGEAF